MKSLKSLGVTLLTCAALSITITGCSDRPFPPVFSEARELEDQQSGAKPATTPDEQDLDEVVIETSTGVRVTCLKRDPVTYPAISCDWVGAERPHAENDPASS